MRIRTSRAIRVATTLALTAGLAAAAAPASADVPPLPDLCGPGCRRIAVDFGELQVFNEGNCSLMLVNVHVNLPVDVPAIEALYDVNDACQVVNASARITTPDTTDQPGLQSVGLGRGLSLPESAPVPGSSTNYIHTSQTLQDVVNIDVAKLKTVTKRWWQPTFWLTWLVDNGYFDDRAKASTSVKWNHPTEVIPGYFDYGCTNTTPCFQATSVWGSHFHTDFTWCNASSESQEMELWTQVYTYGDGTADAIFTQDVHCRGLHHATKVWQNSDKRI